MHSLMDSWEISANRQCRVQEINKLFCANLYLKTANTSVYKQLLVVGVMKVVFKMLSHQVSCVLVNSVFLTYTDSHTLVSTIMNKVNKKKMKMEKLSI